MSNYKIEMLLKDATAALQQCPAFIAPSPAPCLPASFSTAVFCLTSTAHILHTFSHTPGIVCTCAGIAHRQTHSP